MKNSIRRSDYQHMIPNDGYPHVELAECDCNPQLTCVGLDYVYIHTNMESTWEKDAE